MGRRCDAVKEGRERPLKSQRRGKTKTRKLSRDPRHRIGPQRETKSERQRTHWAQKGLGTCTLNMSRKSLHKSKKSGGAKLGAITMAR